MSETKERPVLFSAPMVRAILAGEKTQTRRAVAGQEKWNDVVTDAERFSKNGWRLSDKIGVGSVDLLCPYGSIGDRLWVRETWQYADWTEDGMPFVRYNADGAVQFFDSGDYPEEWNDRLMATWAELSAEDNYSIDNRAADRIWRPSIFMPRWASRITLEIIDVRVERLLEISESDAEAEGIKMNGFSSSIDGIAGREHRIAFRTLWDSINAKRAPWESNPWVWVISFKQSSPEAR